MVKSELTCSNCTIQACWSDNPAGGPSFCPTKTRKKSLTAALKLYKEDAEIRKMAIAAARTEGRSYMKWTRVEDTIDFARDIRNWE